MSGHFTTQTLAEGFVPSAIGVLYQVPATNVGYISSFTISSQNVTPQLITLYKHLNGADYFWANVVLNFGEFADVLDGNKALVLSAGDSIKANSNISNTVCAAFAIHGIQEQ